MRQAERRKHHFIYKTTCMVTGKYYLGMHSTDDLEDGYVGSGKILWHSINKHGRENHSMEILEHLPDRKNLKARERELVSLDTLTDQMCMNLKVGGEGGFTLTKEQYNAGLSKRIETRRNGKGFDTRSGTFHSLEAKEKISKAKIGHKPSFIGKHTDETIAKMKVSSCGKHVGEKNSQFGTSWITNGVESKKIKNADSIPEGWSKGRAKSMR